mmetsp:Transcript_2927/g.7016  ORF Transcript_2927/g.7016 Transcript_2927/m.7016 type:complete len:217 (+) Transcript_2927:3624-4274(+)
MWFPRRFRCTRLVVLVSALESAVAPSARIKCPCRFSFCRLVFWLMNSARTIASSTKYPDPTLMHGRSSNGEPFAVSTSISAPRTLIVASDGTLTKILAILSATLELILLPLRSNLVSEGLSSNARTRIMLPAGPSFCPPSENNVPSRAFWGSTLTVVWPCPLRLTLFKGAGPLASCRMHSQLIFVCCQERDRGISTSVSLPSASASHGILSVPDRM